MDNLFLSLLQHPVSGKPLQYQEGDSRLYEPVSGDYFTIRENVPILLTRQLDPTLTHTAQHDATGTLFSYKEHYQTDARTYDYFKETEDAAENCEHQRLHQYILNELKNTNGIVLDTGCGGGWLSAALKGTGSTVISMDISDINPIKALLKNPYPEHYGLVADVFELPLHDNSIGCIVASEIIEHVPDPRRFLQALYRVLKPGGKMIITTPYNEKIQYSLCIHCNQLTPHNAHLHSFTEAKMKHIAPSGAKSLRTRVFNNKILVRTGVQRLLKWLPLPLWDLLEHSANMLTRKRAYRLMMVVEK